MDETAVLALNKASEVEASPLELEGLRRLVALAWHVGLRSDGRDAFLIAMDERADYANANFHWFKSRYARFVYVDRVIVAATARGRGLGTRLYDELFARASGAGQSLIACEVNVDPPNPASDRLHDRLGFEEVGRAQLASGKLVRYLLRDLRTAM